MSSYEAYSGRRVLGCRDSGLESRVWGTRVGTVSGDCIKTIFGNLLDAAPTKASQCEYFNKTPGTFSEGPLQFTGNLVFRKCIGDLQEIPIP